jgi:hypothetical protein
MAFSQVALKGVELGGYSPGNEKVTTVGGLPGILVFDKMKNEKIWKITFSSTKSYRSENSKFDPIVFYNDFRELIQGIEDNYIISFGIDDITFEDFIEIRSIQFETTKNGVEYRISTHMERENNKEWISFSLRSLRLDQINRNENPNKHDY